MNQFLELPDGALIRWNTVVSVIPLDAIPSSNIAERIRVDFGDCGSHLTYFDSREDRDAFVRYIKSELAALV